MSEFSTIHYFNLIFIILKKLFDDDDSLWIGWKKNRTKIWHSVFHGKGTFIHTQFTAPAL